MKKTLGQLPLALLLALTPSLAQAAEAPCLTEEEANGLVRFALPDVVGQLSNSCAKTLPANAYLIRARADLVERFATTAATSAPVARTALGKMAGLKPAQAANLSDQTLRDLMGIGIAEAVDGKMKPKDCMLIDAVLEQLEPLPADNMARLIGIALREGSKAKPGETPKKNPLRICGGEGGA